MEQYEEWYYGRQVESRGISNAAEATPVFKKMSVFYEEMIGDLLPAPGAALELGCGYGNFLFYLRERGWDRVTGVDLDRRQVDVARDLGLDAHTGDALAFVANASGLDLIAALDLIEHLDKNAAVRLLCDAHRALNPGGVLLVQCPCADGFTGAHDWANDLTHRWAPSSNALRQMLQTAGFGRVVIADLTVPTFPRTPKSLIKRIVRLAARAAVSPFLRILGVSVPAVWSNSQLAVAFRTT